MAAQIRSIEGQTGKFLKLQRISGLSIWSDDRLTSSSVSEIFTDRIAGSGRRELTESTSAFFESRFFLSIHSRHLRFDGVSDCRAKTVFFPPQ